MRHVPAFLFVLIAASAAAADFDPTTELARQSKLPASEVSALLKKCESSDATQMSINFCAWRDLIVAEHQLQQVVDKRSAQSPVCGAALEKRISAWKKKRDARCEKSAKLDYEGGSMLPTAIALCQTAVTERMTKKISGEKTCR
ncbi:DUF1311 domain-containing protein [Trinickia sp. LjRoot230]|uniref:lysozyme inhibitor LprI family protein n=1 Tax=Trinickia sp. LjRoot230 TaxID=3342288 RepID=UPI003ED09F70